MFDFKNMCSHAVEKLRNADQGTYKLECSTPSSKKMERTATLVSRSLMQGYKRCKTFLRWHLYLMKILDILLLLV